MNTARQTPIVQTMGVIYEWTYLVFAMGQNGYMTARNDEDKEPVYKPDGSPVHFRGDRPYFLQVLQGRPFGQQVLISRTNNQPAHCLSVPIREPNATVAGALITCSLLTEVSKTVADIRIGTTGFAFLVDDSGKVLAHGQPSKVKEVLQDFSTHPVLTQGITKRLLRVNDSGNPIVAYAMEADLGWKLVVQQDEVEAFAALHEAQRQTLVLLVVSVVGIGLLAFLLARGLTKPLRALTAVADEYSRGALDVAIPGSERSDEIGALAHALERMGLSIKMAMAKLSQR